jgi:hypothetical protein
VATAKADAKTDAKADVTAPDATPQDTVLVNSVNGMAEARRAPDPEKAKASPVLVDAGSTSGPVVGDDDAVYPDGVPGQVIRPEELPDPELQKTIGVDPAVWRNNGKVYIEGEPTPA